MLNFQNELRKRKEDLVLSKRIFPKLTSSEQDEDEGQRIVELMAISRKHTATIKEISDQ